MSHDIQNQKFWNKLIAIPGSGEIQYISQIKMHLRQYRKTKTGRKELTVDDGNHG